MLLEVGNLYEWGLLLLVKIKLGIESQQDFQLGIESIIGKRLPY
jgi:hypothetical protein